jgi:hypothetical protein
MIDGVTGAHDLKGEAQMLGHLTEDSPYPEVSLLHHPDYVMANSGQGPRCRKKL